MAKPRTLVLTGEGINCDYETRHAFELAGSIAERVHINRLINKEVDIDNYQIFSWPGGFSFGDDIASARILVSWLKTNLSDKLRKFVDDGKLLLGICNGGQAVIKYGLAPALSDYETQDATLTYNDSSRFECRWTNLVSRTDKCVFTQGIDTIELPNAHGEGKFFVDPEKPELLEIIENQNLVVFKYADAHGNPANGRYPANPNGSINDIAAVCDPTGRILAIMPHPERYVDPKHHPQWTRQRRKGTLPEKGPGLKMFENAVNYFK